MGRPTNHAKRTFKDAEHDILRLMEALRALNLPTAVELLELTLAEVRDQAGVRARVTSLNLRRKVVGRSWIETRPRSG